MLTIKDFSKSYDGDPVITVPHIRFEKGIHWIKGDNGSGKSTFFKSLVGLLPHQGNITFDDGIDLTQNPVAFRRLINYGEAEPNYPDFLTANDLIQFVGKTKGATRQQQKSIIEFLNIGSFLHKSCETYSSGMLKKLSLVIAFIGNPRLIVLDEPLITLDETARNALFTMINEYMTHRDVTFMLSSHQLIDSVFTQTMQRYHIENKTIIQD